MPSYRLQVEPKLQPADRKALSAFMKAVKLNRPTFIAHGNSFNYRGSQVTVLAS